LNPLTLLALLGDPRFGIGAVAGGVAAVIFRVGGRRLDWFLLWAFAGAAALAVTDGLDWSSNVRPWALGAAGGAILAVGVSTFRLLPRTAFWVPRVLFALAVLGVWGTVPDTEHARVLMGVTAALLVLGFGQAQSPVTRPGLMLATAVLAYVVLVDGWPRDSSIVGALGSLGMLVVAPITSAVQGMVAERRNERESAPRWLEGWSLVAAQVLLVILSGRVAGRVDSAVSAAVILLVSCLLVAAAWLGVSTWLQRPRPRTGRPVR
jgi:hypothetical protein